MNLLRFNWLILKAGHYLKLKFQTSPQHCKTLQLKQLVSSNSIKYRNLLKYSNTALKMQEDSHCVCGI